MAFFSWVSFEGLNLKYVKLRNEKHRNTWIKATEFQGLVKQRDETLVIIHCFPT